jgi:LPXTG-motif cell wall-anchored protein
LRLRDVFVAALVPVVLALAVPAVAATYPPGPPTTQVTVVPGVVYGGPKTGVMTLSVCAGASTARTVHEGQAILIEVCTFLPGSLVKMYVTPPAGAQTHVGDMQADGNGAVVGGPFRLTHPGHYRFSFKGTAADVQGLGVGGVSSRGMSRPMADPNHVVNVDITVPAAGNLAQTGGDGGGRSATVWGAALVLVGTMLVLLYVRRRRRPSSVEPAVEAS